MESSDIKVGRGNNQRASIAWETNSSTLTMISLLLLHHHTCHCGSGDISLDKEGPRLTVKNTHTPYASSSQGRKEGPV